MIAFFRNIKSDYKNYNFNNSNEQQVLDAHYFSAYKRTFVLKLPIGTNGASLGVLFIGNKVRTIEMIRHEYGHKVQLKEMGILRYLFGVAIPSVTANVLDRMGKLPYDYYGSRWEAEADRLGEVRREKNNTPWPKNFYRSYKDLIKLFFVKRKK